MMSQPRRKGFSLIETVVAVFILAIAVPPMMWAVRQAQRQRVNPMLASKARWLAVEKIEDVIADRHSVSGSRGYDFLTTGNYPTEAKGSISGYPQFERRVTFNETEADLSTPGDGYMNVTVEVEWNDASGQTETLSISTVLTEYVPT